MQKLKLSVASFFIISFFVFSFGCISVNAEFMPPVVPDSASMSWLPDFLATTMSYNMTQHGGTYVSKNEASHFYELLNGHSLIDSVNTRYLSVKDCAWKNNLTTNFYNSNGDVIDPDNVIIAWASSDVATCTYCYDATTGELLKQGDSFSNSTSTIQSLSGETIYDPWGDRFDPLGLLPQVEARVKSVNFAIVELDVPESIREHFINHDFTGYFRNNQYGSTVFVPNGCSSTCLIEPYQGNYNFSGTSASFGATPNIFCYSPSDIITVGVEPQNALQRGNYSYYGTYFPYTGNWYPGINIMYMGGEIHWKAPTLEEYNAMKNVDVVNAQPCDVVNNYSSPYYSYDKIITNNPTYNTYNNNNYDYSSPITTNNYPIYTSITYPDYSPINNNYYETINNYYETYNNPSINDEQQIPEITNPNEYPLLSNLEKRFPFSIPYDIKNMISLLSAPRETPYIDEDIEIPNLVSGQPIIWHFEYDLHEFDDTAELFRKLFLILYVITLAYWCYDHFFGS